MIGGRAAACHHALMRYELTTALRLVAWLYLATGVMLLVAPFLAFQAAQGVGPNLVLFPLAAITLAASFGLFRRAPWAWALTALLAVSGVVVTVARLWAGGAPGGLVPALVTNLIVLLVLYLARSRAPAEVS